MVDGGDDGADDTDDANDDADGLSGKKPAEVGLTPVDEASDAGALRWEEAEEGLEALLLLCAWLESVSARLSVGGSSFLLSSWARSGVRGAERVSMAVQAGSGRRRSTEETRGRHATRHEQCCCSAVWFSAGWGETSTAAGWCG